MHSMSRQKGSVLIVCVVILLLATMFALSSNSSTITSLRVVGNSQALKTLEYNAAQAIEIALSSLATFQAPSSQTITVNGQPVTVTPAACISYGPAAGYSALYALSPEDTNWEMQASGTEPVSGASVTMTQGVKIRLNAGYCS